jgi:hypothetical protein
LGYLVVTGSPIRALLLLACLHAVAIHDLARADPSRLNARVVWTQGDRAYVALLDTLTVSPGLPLAFRDGTKEIAAGACTGARAGDVIEARIHSGSLARVKRLERIAVIVERPSWTVPRIVRWGYPSRARRTLLFRCDRYTPRPEALGPRYRIETAGGEGWRLVRDERHEAAWPDTIEVRLFDSATDQEIALQRGEIDAALFWPGEASDHLRGLPVWADRLSAPREQGLLVATGNRELDQSAFAPLAAMNETLFGGDLRPHLRPDGLAGGAPPPAAPAPVHAVYEVDPALPGAGALRRALAADGGARRDARSPSPTVRVTFLPVSVDPDSIARALLAVDRGAVSAPRSIRFFTLDCPIVARPEILPFLRRVGAREFVNLFDCGPSPETR